MDACAQSRKSILATKLRRTLVDRPGLQPRGPSKPFAGAAEASWVGSMPIHPANFRSRDSQHDSHGSRR